MYTYIYMYRHDVYYIGLRHFEEIQCVGLRHRKHKCLYTYVYMYICIYVNM